MKLLSTLSGRMLVIGLPLLLAAPAYAQSEIRDTLDAVGSPAYGDSDPNALMHVIASLVQSALTLVGIILVVLMLYAGFLWMTAGGEEEKVTKAKGLIRDAVIGLAIVMAAMSISIFVVRTLESATTGSSAVSSQEGSCVDAAGNPC
jgi:hypothetical protein